MPEWVKCDICQSNDTTILYQGIRDYRYAVDGSFNIVKCERCGLVYTNPRPTKGEISKYYPDSYYAYIYLERDNFLERLKEDIIKYKAGRTTGLPFAFKPLLFLLKNTVTLVPEKEGRILDIGCASGRLLATLKKMGWDCYGVEIDEEAVLVARGKGLNVVQGDIEECSFPENYFDSIRLSHVLEHLPSPRKVLTKIRAWLKSDGKLYIGIPNYKCIYTHLFRKYTLLFEVPRHFYHFDKQSISLLLSETGYKTENIRYNSFHSSILLESLENLLRDKFRSLPSLNMSKFTYLSPVPIISTVLDKLGLGDAIEIVAAKKES